MKRSFAVTTLLAIVLLMTSTVQAAAQQATPAAEYNRTIVQISEFNFAQTRARILDAIKTRHLTLFAELDHAAAARDNGLQMPETTVLVFGNPKGGTPLMLAHPSLALDLPYRVLIAQQADGKVIVSYPAPDSFRVHHLNDQHIAGLAAIPKVIEAALAP